MMITNFPSKLEPISPSPTPKTTNFNAKEPSGKSPIKLMAYLMELYWLEIPSKLEIMSKKVTTSLGSKHLIKVDKLLRKSSLYLLSINKSKVHLQDHPLPQPLEIVG